MKSGGASFTVTLPLFRISKSEDETSRPEQSQPVSDASGIRILNFDDEPGILDILYSTFQQDGYIVHTALRGEHGIDYINKNIYDAILLDIRLPDTDGTVLYNRIKELKPELAPRIIFVTGDTVTKMIPWPLSKKPKSISDQAFRHRKSPSGRCR